MKLLDLIYGQKKIVIDIQKYIHIKIKHMNNYLEVFKIQMLMLLNLKVHRQDKLFIV